MIYLSRYTLVVLCEMFRFVMLYSTVYLSSPDWLFLVGVRTGHCAEDEEFITRRSKFDNSKVMQTCLKKKERKTKKNNKKRLTHNTRRNNRYALTVFLSYQNTKPFCLNQMLSALNLFTEIVTFWQNLEHISPSQTHLADLFSLNETHFALWFPWMSTVISKGSKSETQLKHLCHNLNIT